MPVPKDDSRERELESDLQEARRQLEEAAEQAQTLEAALKKVRMRHLNVVICLDVTGSMTGQVEGLKREITTLAKVLESLAPSAGIGVVAFGDRTWRQTIHQQPLVLASNLAALQSIVNRLSPNMDPQARRNRDGPEAVATALDQAVAMSWRPESRRRYVIVITDNAAYPERVASALRTAQQFSGRDGSFVSAVRANFTQDPRDRQAADRFLRQLAEAGNGQFVDAAGGESMMGTVLLAILNT